MLTKTSQCFLLFTKFKMEKNMFKYIFCYLDTASFTQIIKTSFTRSTEESKYSTSKELFNEWIEWVNRWNRRNSDNYQQQWGLIPHNLSQVRCIYSGKNVITSSRNCAALPIGTANKGPQKPQSGLQAACLVSVKESSSLVG